MYLRIVTSLFFYIFYIFLVLITIILHYTTLLYTNTIFYIIYSIYTTLYAILYIDKQVLITMLERLGEVTAMTGDGVNGRYIYEAYVRCIWVYMRCVYTLQYYMNVPHAQSIIRIVRVAIHIL